MEKINPLLEYGHIHFGENKVQEAKQKWNNIREKYQKIKLHLIGRLQTNKVKYVIDLFDYIHSVDNIKLAEKIAAEENKKNKKLSHFIQVNIGQEKQKSGIEITDLENFYSICKNKLNLNIIGLMCIPPNDDKSEIYYSKMQHLKKKLNLPELSMGMSNDYVAASKYDATFIRVGTKIFGERV